MRIFSDSGNEFLLAFSKRFHTLQRLLTCHLLFLWALDLHVLLKWSHSFLQTRYYRDDLLLARSLLYTARFSCRMSATALSSRHLPIGRLTNQPRKPCQVVHGCRVG